VSLPSDPAKFCIAKEGTEAPGTTITKHGFLQISNCGVISNTLRTNFRVT